MMIFFKSSAFIKASPIEEKEQFVFPYKKTNIQEKYY